MKKIMSLSIAALALAAMLTGCASSGSSSSKSGATAPTVPHPRTYVVDPADAGTTWSLPFNSYGPNYQSLKDTSHYKLVKLDKPQAGDTVQLRGRFVSDVDIPKLFFHMTDQSPAGNYWTILGDANVLVAENIVAGEPVDISVDYVLAKEVKGDFTACFVYDQDASENPQMEGVAKVSKAAKFTFEKVADSTDTANEVVPVAHVAARDVAVQKFAAFFEVATNHPWVNGAQDMSVISNYQGMCDISNLYGEDLPVAGDTVNVTWKAKSDTDIAKLYMRLIDNSAAANWWKELDTNGGAGIQVIENIVAGEVFEMEPITLTFSDDAVGAVALCIWYDVGDANGPAIITLVRE